ncbi:tetratricopeptide repeat protein [Paenibacillus beijingensis]|uniref:Transcriptional regulator n=1 Tax=Paenibacillus beijingensis TaxID=1126833 RepID=A0A0D5NI79_9BACL|nr:tetratricopeptide repeat protein [Paenibacillus beijingensis]AJY74667.1 transcriptional regulator [Paenibacillus beijingensis]
MAELEDQEAFAELLTRGVTALKQHPDYITKRKKREALPSGRSFSESYLDKIAMQLGISSNTIKSWMGQMGVKYIPGRIEDSKLFGIVWLIIEKSGMDAKWFTELLRTTSMPVLEPPLPVWVASCLRKAKISRQDDLFGAPPDEAIERVTRRLFAANSGVQAAAHLNPARTSNHNLPARWTNAFIGRKLDLQAILQWLQSPQPVCLITGWGGMGKTTLSLEAAYACVGQPQGEAASSGLCWPELECVIWVSAELKSVSFGDFLDTIAYQLGRVELLDKSVHEKRFVVRNALAAFSAETPVLLIIDSIDTAEPLIHEFVVNLPQGVKALLTARDNPKQIAALAIREIQTLHLDGLEQLEALEYLKKEALHQMRRVHAAQKKEQLARLLAEQDEALEQLISAAAGNPKALTLSVGYIAVHEVPVGKLIRGLREAAHSLSALFEYLFGRAWESCTEDARRLWQTLCLFGRPPGEEAWAAAAGLDEKRFYSALEQLIGLGLAEAERSGDRVGYRAHQTVVAYGEHHLTDNPGLESEARLRWSSYYLDFWDAQIKRSKPDEMYWNYLLGRDLDNVKHEWPNLLKLLRWAAGNGESELLIALMLRVSHFLSRINLQLRIDYGHQAADAAAHIGRSDLEALFRIDTIGWARMETGNLEEGIREIEEGLQLLKRLDPEDTTVRNLNILGKSFKSKYYLKIHQPDEAAAILQQIASQHCSPVIKHRVLLLQGDLHLLRGNYREAVDDYEQANELSASYGGEKTIEAYFNLGVAYLRLGELRQAEAAFENLLYHKSKANQIELIYYRYGNAQLSWCKGEYETALRLTREALAIIYSWERTFGLEHEVQQFYDRIAAQKAET